MKESTGKWVLFADSDDYFLEDFYSKVEKYFRSESDIICFNPTSIDEYTLKESDRHKKYSSIVKNYIYNKNIKNEVKLRYDFSVPWSKMYKKELILNNNIFFDEIMVSNDVMFSTRAGYTANQITASLEIIYCVTNFAGSLTKNMTKENFNTRRSVRISQCNYLNERLSKEELQFINMSGRGPMINAIIYKMGVKKILETYIILKKNNINVIDKEYLNPFYLFKKVKITTVNYIKNRSYINRE